MRYDEKSGELLISEAGLVMSTVATVVYELCDGHN